MSFASKYNNTVSFDIDTTGFEFVKLSDLYAKGADTVTKINGMYVCKGKLDTAPVFICADIKALVNIPSHRTQTVKDILNDEEAVQDIRDGKVGFKVYTYESHGKVCYSIRFVDL